MAEPVPLFAAIADAHLDIHGAWRHKGILGDAEHSFTQVVRYCCDHKVPWLFILGDTINRPDPKPAIVKFLYDQMDTCQARGVRVGYILGQHEAGQDWLGIHPWPKFLDGKFTDIAYAHLHIYGISFKPGDAFQAALAAMPAGVDILLAHQVWGDWMGSIANPQACFADLPDDVYLITGDYHKHLVTPFDNDQREAYSCGSLAMQDINEEPEKRFWVCVTGLDEAWTMQSVPLSTRRVIRLQGDNAADIDRIVSGGPLAINTEISIAADAGLPALLTTPIVEVTYFEDIPEATRRLNSALGPRCHLFLKPKPHQDGTVEVAAAEQERREIADRGLIAALELTVLPDDPVYDAIHRLFAAVDPKYELETMRAEQQCDSSVPS